MVGQLVGAVRSDLAPDKVKAVNAECKALIDKHLMRKPLPSNGGIAYPVPRDIKEKITARKRNLRAQSLPGVCVDVCAMCHVC